MKLRKRIWALVDIAKPGDIPSRILDLSMLLLIVLNIFAIILSSVQSIHVRFAGFFNRFEFFSVAVFTAEYAARLWSCTADPRFHGKVRGRIRFALHGMSIIDLLSILPFYLPFWSADLRILRALRLLRIVRIAKIGRYYPSLNLIRHVFASRKEELVLTTFLMGVLLIVSSSILYYCENGAQPETFSSIPAAMWWAVATLTTVGYGDMYPVTVTGKICASIVAILGIGMFALPTGILGAGFMEAVQKKRATKKTCPHCGQEIE